jgi:hypothetical protein
MTSTTPRWVWALFVAVVVWVPVQAVIIARYGEPYPSLMMPSFGRTFVRDGLYQISGATIAIDFHDGSSATITPNVLFERLPPTHYYGLLSLHFWPRAGGPETRVSRRQVIKQWLVPGYVRREQKEFGGAAPDDAMRAWLRARAVTLFPGRVPRACHIIFFERAYRRDLTVHATRELARRSLPL